MRTCLIFSLLIAATTAVADEKENHLDPVPSATDIKALEGRVDPAVRKVVAEATKAEVKPLPLPQSRPEFSSASADVMTAAFNAAKLPDCLHSEGLRNQPTFLLTGYLALPFIAVAKLRGVCS